MMKIAKTILTCGLLGLASVAFGAGVYGEPENPTTGIWIQQVGDIVPHEATKEILYYTKYAENDRVKSLDYQYDGNGYLRLSNKKTLCTMGDGMGGADGIVHHPQSADYLVVAAQGNSVYKIDKNAGANTKKCVVGSSTTKEGVWHLMNDPTGNYVWAAGIPGKLHRIWTSDKSKNYFDSEAYNVTVDYRGFRENKKQVTTLIWDKENNAFFTYSDYFGGGCERKNDNDTLYSWNGSGSKASPSNDFRDCVPTERAKEAAKAYFGYVSDTTKVYIKSADSSKKYHAPVGSYAITSLGLTVLIDKLEGAHGGTYDPYSNTIFLFGGSKIRQIKVNKKNGQMSASVVATIDMREMFFLESYKNLTKPRTDDNVGWRLDQGTVDGHGHLFVASNTGHLVFVDYSSNPQKYINDNILVHVQWIDNWLDDVAPLDIHDAVLSNASTGVDKLSSNSIGMSSSRQEHTSSSKAVSSSSKKVSSSSVKSSSSSNRSSSSRKEYTSSSVSSDSGDSSSSKGNGNSSDDKSSSSKNDDSGSSSSSKGGDDDDDDDSSSSKGKGNSSANDDDDNSSSSRKVNGGGDELDESSSSARVYVGFDDYDESDSGLDFYPSNDNYEYGDSIVAEAVVLQPVDDVKGKKSTKVGDNVYWIDNNPTAAKLDLRYGSGLDSAQVGQVVAITLDSAKVKKIFGSPDSLKIVSRGTLDMVNPADGSRLDTVSVNADGSVTIWITSDTVAYNGSILVAGGDKVAIIDGLNFYDPIPDAKVGFVKDTDGDKVLDFEEILLDDTIPANITVKSIETVINGKSQMAKNVIQINSSRDRVSVDVTDMKFPDKFPEDAYAIITYETENGTCYTRQVSLLEVGNNVINSAYAIHDKSGKDSLFIKFNIDLVPADIENPDMLVMIKQNLERRGFNLNEISNVYMPSRNLVILVGDSLGLKGNDKDSISLYPNATFQNLQYITSDEYEREIPVKVVDRVPSVKNVEYLDTDGDGVLDQIVTNFNKKLTSEDVSMLYMSYPWYSYRGMLIQLMAEPRDLIMDPEDSTRVIWNVQSSTMLTTGLTSINEDLPPATVYTYYDVLGETFINEENAVIVDKMSPVIVGAVLNYGKSADTLAITFSEVIKNDKLKGRDFFKLVHGNDTLELNPSRLDWSSDGKTATLVLDGSVMTILPGDSLMVVRGERDCIEDNFGNVAGENPSSVVIAGLLNHLVESTNMGTFDAADDVFRTVSSVNLRYVPSSTTKEDLEKEGALGQLVQLGERFVPQLVDRAQISADGSVDPNALDSLKPEDIFITFVVNYWDHLGHYVNDTSITVQCNSWKFGGNCLETNKKVFVNWNFKDHEGRFVGTGVYMVQFKMVVRYDKKSIEEEIKDKWGVRRKHGRVKK